MPKWFKRLFKKKKNKYPVGEDSYSLQELVQIDNWYGTGKVDELWAKYRLTPGEAYVIGR